MGHRWNGSKSSSRMSSGNEKGKIYNFSLRRTSSTDFDFALLIHRSFFHFSLGIVPENFSLLAWERLEDDWWHNVANTSPPTDLAQSWRCGVCLLVRLYFNFVGLKLVYRSLLDILWSRRTANCVNIESGTNATNCGTGFCGHLQVQTEQLVLGFFHFIGIFLDSHFRLNWIKN